MKDKQGYRAFARQKYPGWDCWGNEMSGDEVIPQDHKVIEKIPKKLFNRNKQNETFCI